MERHVLPQSMQSWALHTKDWHVQAAVCYYKCHNPRFFLEVGVVRSVSIYHCSLSV